MHPVKQLLQAHRPVFVAGMLGMERYEWFYGLTDPLFQSSIPTRATDESVDIPLFFFPSREHDAWVELESGEFMSLPVLGETVSRVIARYFPIPNHLVPDGFIFILPPPFGKSFASAPFSTLQFQEGIWLKPDARLFWVDCFSFGSKDSLETLASLRLGHDLLDTTVCLLRSGRRYGYSDLTGEDAAIKAAEQEWVSRGNETVVIDIQTNRSLLTSLLYKKRSYSLPIRSLVKRDVREKHSLCRKYFRDDYELMVLSKVTPGSLDPIFAYEDWVNNSAGLIAGWNEQARTRLLPKLNEGIMTFVNTKLDDIEVYDLDKLVQAKLGKLWQQGFAHINGCFQRGDKLPKELSKIQYLAAITSYKVQYIEAFTHVIHAILFTALEEIIEKHYELWNRLA